MVGAAFIIAGDLRADVVEQAEDRVGRSAQPDRLQSVGDAGGSRELDPVPVAGWAGVASFRQRVDRDRFGIGAAVIRLEAVRLAGGRGHSQAVLSGRTVRSRRLVGGAHVEDTIGRGQKLQRIAGERRNCTAAEITDEGRRGLSANASCAHDVAIPSSDRKVDPVLVVGATEGMALRGSADRNVAGRGAGVVWLVVTGAVGGR